MGLVGMPPIGPSRRLIGPGFFRWFRCAILLHVHSRVGSSLNAALSGRPPPLWPLLGDLVVHRQGKASGGWVARQAAMYGLRESPRLFTTRKLLTSQGWSFVPYGLFVQKTPTAGSSVTQRTPLRC
eukprot:GHVR01096461.1.p1 GENE.GHVR01096461.1~~GHVR01096461.1.p1  ORF type:complete len:126 (+),score=6.90 GHVR01096461.1:182-559(+)